MIELIIIGYVKCQGQTIYRQVEILQGLVNLGYFQGHGVDCRRLLGKHEKLQDQGQSRFFGFGLVL